MIWHSFCTSIRAGNWQKAITFAHLTHLKLRMEENNKLLNSIIEGIQEKKGKKISQIQLKGVPGAICDYFVICEGNTPTQVGALADSVEKAVKVSIGESPIRVQGQQRSEWIGIDYGNIIVHIFLPDLRQYYNLDNLWDDAHVVQTPSLD